MGVINEPLKVRATYSGRKSEIKFPLAGRKPTTHKPKPLVSEHISIKRRPVIIRETK